ncbi:MAG: Lcl C-terminal domain-containing protein [Candidatus Electronema sp. V4]|uniref:Lcl C-terminal domain-containing protein n=1 Tax=Candidatus Electronema sp. V4 TaxID=3454756 RepID=UPI00405561FD
MDDQLQLMSGGQGTFIMTASTGFQTAVEKEGDQLGLFTKHLVEGIRSGEADRDEDGFVDIHELYQHVNEKVRAEGAQEPMKWDINAKGRMIIAKSGRNAKEQRRLSVRETLFELVEDDKLTPGIALEAVQLLSIPKHEMTAKDQECFLLIEHLVGAKISPSVFMEQWWLRNCFARHASPKPQKDIKIGQYIDHGDGTITDTKTGLMWKRCAEGLSGVNCEEGKLEKYTWDDAVESFKDVEYAGYSDWRLPTIEELKTLVYCSKGKNKNNGCCNDGSAVPTINQQAFPNTEETFFWSGSPSAVDSDLANGVDFYYGGSYFSGRSLSSAVRLVRGGQ